MTRAELIKLLSSKYPNLPCSMLENIVKSVFNVMVSSLVEQQRIEIRGFGSFSLRHRKARVARNPKTGELLNTTERFSVHFKPGKELRERANNT